MRFNLQMQKISVIVPIYKVEKYLCKCVDSVLAQTYKNLEIILVDDGSPDKCSTICDEYVKTDARIKVIHKQNGGLSDARNVGIRAASGEFITFVDSDDFILPDMIKTLYSLAQQYSADIAVCATIRCDESGAISYTISEKKVSVVDCLTDNRKMEALIVNDKIPTMACGKLYSKELFEEIRFPFGKLHEDVFVMHHLVHIAKTVVTTSVPCYVYRQNAASIMATKFSVRRLDAIDASIARYNFIKKYYPQFTNIASGNIIWSCNFCLRSMAHAGYYDKEIFERIKLLYRQHYKNYFRFSKSSICGKIETIITLCSIRLAYFCHKYVEK